MKNLLLSIGVLASLLPASAQLTREGVATLAPQGSPAAAREVPVDARLLAREGRRATATVSDPRFRVVERNVAPRPERRSKAAQAPASGSMKASGFEGYCIWVPMGAATKGYYTFSNSGISQKWSQPSGMTTPAAGFVRDGKLYAFAHLATTTGITAAGMYLMEASDGTPIGTLDIDIFDGLQQVVLSAAYDSDSDTAYVVTYDKSGSGYLFQKFNPETYQFTDLGVSVPSDWLALAWSPVDKTAYLLDESCGLKKYDSRGKRFVSAVSLSYPDMSDYLTAMSYSPKDEAFLAMIPTYDSNDEETFDAVLLGLNGKATKVANIGDYQWGILECNDAYVDAAAPKAPQVVAEVSGPALTGSLSVTLPAQLESGAAITGSVYLDATLDGTALTGLPSGKPGDKVSIPVSVAEGQHRYVISAYILGDDGRKFSAPAIVDRYFGHDAPMAPAGVKLTASQISWNAVTEGAHSGYVDPSAITYNVYLDGVKLNASPVADTKYAVSISGASSEGHLAEVEALCGGKTSEKGASGRYYGSGAMSLPVEIVPGADGDIPAELQNLFSVQKDPLNTEELRGWRYDDQNEHTGGFYVLCPKESTDANRSDEWLFLPAINFPDKDALYRFTMDVWTGNHYFTSPETYEVTLTKRPSSAGATVIRPAETVGKKEKFETSETVFSVPEAGTWYIGIHYISPVGSYRLYTRNYRVAEADATPEAPAAVTGLTATPAAKGGLSADLSFTMPSLSVGGTALDASTQITATARTEAGEATVNAAPCAAVKLTVPTAQGDNTIRVTTSSAAGRGLQAETTCYTGVYRPGTPDVAEKASDDNCTLNVEITVPELNELGQYAGTDGDAIIYRRVSDQWAPYENIGAKRQWSFTVPDASTQDLYQFGVAIKNAAGTSETMTTFGVHLGKPFTVPMNETYALDGENVIMKYEPVSIQNFSEYPAQWGFVNPTEADENAANSSGVALSATWAADTQLSLPRFSTAGHSNVKAAFNLFFGDRTPDFISIYATSPACECELVAQFTPADGKGWESKLVSLPASCQNQGWVQLDIRLDITTYSQVFLMDAYSVADYPEKMVSCMGMGGNSRAVVGEPVDITVDLQNAGVSAVPVPGYTFRLIGDNGVIGELKAVDAPASIAAGATASLRFSFTPKAADLGNVLARFTLQGQPAQAVSEVEKAIEVLEAQLPTVDDLAGAVLADGGVQLTWSPAKYVEGFEAADKWGFSENLRGFRNIDRDLGTPWSVTEVSYPSKFTPKSFLVFCTDGTTIDLLKAHGGSQYLLGMSTSKGATDNWLISPEVKGGSKVSFWLDPLDPTYPETLYVMYSTTGNEPDDFVQLGEELTPAEKGWKNYEFTLPANAKYFALWQNNYNGADAFGLRIDDIHYEPASPAAVADGYNLYRDGQLLVAGLTGTSYTDATADTSAPVQYVLRTTGIVNGERVESTRSNVVWVTPSAVDGLGMASGISAGDGCIVAEGLAGSQLVVSDAAGRVVLRATVASDREAYAVAPGVYVAKCGAKAVKLIVR